MKRCFVGIFVEEHIEMSKGASLEASQQSNYVKFIGNESEKSNDAEDKRNDDEKQRDGSRSRSILINQSIVCAFDREGGYPSKYLGNDKFKRRNNSYLPS